MSDLMGRCGICNVPIKELPAYEYCECEHCEGHRISGYKMGCEHDGNVNLMDLQKTINHYRSGALDEIVRSYKEDKAQRKGAEERVRPFVAEVPQEAVGTAEKTETEPCECADCSIAGEPTH